MNRNMFLTDLGKLLSFMTEEERARTLREYERRLEEAGPEGEQLLLAEYGSATKVAVEIFRAYKLGEPVFPAGEDEAEAAPEDEFEDGTETLCDAEEEVEAEVPVEVEAETETGAEAEVESEVEAETEVEVEAEPEIEAEAEPESETEVEAEVAEEAEEEAPVEAEVEAEPEIEVEPVAEAVPEVAVKADAAPEREPVFVELPPPPEFLIPKAAPEPDTELMEYRIPGWAVALVMLFTCWLWIPLIVVQYALAIVLFAVFLALALVCVAGCGGLVISAIWAFDKIPDALLMIGAAAILLAIGLVLLWFAIWLLIVLLRLITAGIRGTYRGIFRRKTGKERAR
ncbi:MAG: hypothetical protein IKK00_03305 [Oscillospiraceae bacterium]|nr:hypothetical protein [Oscillospiraceae bacterium]